MGSACGNHSGEAELGSGTGIPERRSESSRNRVHWTEFPSRHAGVGWEAESMNDERIDAGDCASVSVAIPRVQAFLASSPSICRLIHCGAPPYPQVSVFRPFYNSRAMRYSVPCMTTFEPGIWNEHNVCLHGTPAIELLLEGRA
jgi:hypothetical protein